MPGSYNDPNFLHNQAILIGGLDITEANNANIAKMLTVVKKELEELETDNFPESFGIWDFNSSFWDFVDFTSLGLGSGILTAETFTVDITVQELCERLGECNKAYKKLEDKYKVYYNIHTDTYYQHIVILVKNFLNLIRNYKASKGLQIETVGEGVKETTAQIMGPYYGLVGPQ